MRMHDSSDQSVPSAVKRSKYKLNIRILFLFRV